MIKSKPSSSRTVCKTVTELSAHISNMGTEMTTDIFIVEDVIYVRMLKHTLTTTHHFGSTPSHKLSITNCYLSWNYKLGIRKEVDSCTFWTQQLLFNYYKRIHDDFIGDIVQDIFDYNLSTIAFQSELLFS